MERTPLRGSRLVEQDFHPVLPRPPAIRPAPFEELHHEIPEIDSENDNKYGNYIDFVLNIIYDLYINILYTSFRGA